MSRGQIDPVFNYFNRLGWFVLALRRRLFRLWWLRRGPRCLRLIGRHRRRRCLPSDRRRLVLLQRSVNALNDRLRSIALAFTRMRSLSRCAMIRPAPAA